MSIARCANSWASGQAACRGGVMHAAEACRLPKHCAAARRLSLSSAHSCLPCQRTAWYHAFATTCAQSEHLALLSSTLTHISICVAAEHARGEPLRKEVWHRSTCQALKPCGHAASVNTVVGVAAQSSSRKVSSLKLKHSVSAGATGMSMGVAWHVFTAVRGQQLPT